MLNRAKIFKEIQEFSDEIFFNYDDELEIAFEAWKKIAQDKEFLNKVEQSQAPWIMPTWNKNESPGNTHVITPKSSYTVIATDGSQIYPDRHRGISCFLLNIGSVILGYDIKKYKFDSEPFVFACNNSEESVEIVDCKRQEFEFKFGLEIMREHKEALFLFDGSIIFWHLEAKSANVKQEYLSKYLGYLHQFYKDDLLIAGYISLPKSKELINLIRLNLAGNLDGQTVDHVDHIVDTQIADFFLKPFTRTILFKNHSPIVESYPEHLKPYFFYMNVGHEIIRIEIPSWIALNPDKVELISSIVMDQCVKGFGYPVCLAEAHDQAVVKGPDSDFFYQILNKLSIERNQRILASQKSMKKRRMGI